PSTSPNRARRTRQRPSDRRRDQRREENRMTLELGPLALHLGLVLAIYSVVTSLLGVWWRRRDVIASGEHAALAVWGCVVVAAAVLLQALASRDFRIEYVAAYSSSTLPLYY